jgi:hypothetical protein
MLHKERVDELSKAFTIINNLDCNTFELIQSYLQQFYGKQTRTTAKSATKNSAYTKSYHTLTIIEREKVGARFNTNVEPVPKYFPVLYSDGILTLQLFK